MQEIYAQQLERKIAETHPITSRDLARTISPSQPASNVFKQLEEGKWQGTKFGIATFYDFAPQVITFMNTLNGISFGILIVLLVITMIGISNTFKIIVYERRGSRNHALLRCYEKTYKASFSCRSFIFILIRSRMRFCTCCSCNAGYLVYSDSCRFTFFGLYQKRILCVELIRSFSFLKFVIMLGLTLLTVRGSASRAANMIPAEALRSGK